MPHSSGGGSHSGGSHSSSSSSSGSSHFGSSSAVSYRDHYFPGSRRYLYYDSAFNHHYFYFDGDRPGVSFTEYLIPIAMISIFILIGIFILYQAAFDKPEKLSGTGRVSVEDTLDLMTDDEEDALFEELLAFYEKTGIVPTVLTVSNDVWINDYNSLEDYAYELYVSNLPDESQWLLVYSQPTEPNEKFNEWYWEGMQGDDTDDILNDTILDTFNSAVQKGLYQEDLTNTFIDAFEAIEPDLMKAVVDKELLFFAVFWLSFCVLFLVSIIISIRQNSKYNDATYVENGSPEYKCPYCGCVYTKETKAKYGTCRKCGGML